jgi:hypothetical protein
MGWSCSAAANFTLDAIVAIQQKLGSVTSNGLVINGNTNAGFWESSRKEHDDGSITGSVWTMVDADHCRKTGSFRINANGTIERFSSIPRRLLIEAENVGARKFRTVYGIFQADRENVKNIPLD